MTDLGERLVDIPAVAAILPAAAEAARSEGVRVLLVGGAVRDLLLGRRTLDVDLVVEGDGVAVAERLARALGGTLLVHGPFGTADVRVDDRLIDVASARAESYAAPGALPTVRPGTLNEDLRRRDFTVNTMAVVLGPGPAGELVDPLDARADLATGRLRVLHPASFVDDPTRLLRAARYEARLGLRLTPDAEALARAAATPEAIWSVGATRLADALVLAAAEDDGVAGRALARLAELGVLHAIDPALDAGPAAQGRISHWESLRAEHAPEAVPWRARLGLLLAPSGGEAADAVVDRLRLSRRDAEAVAAVARAGGSLPARPSELVAALEGLPVEAQVAAGLDDAGAAIRYLDELRHVRPALDGDDLQRELGLAPGPELGAILRELRRARLDGELTTRDDELARARGLAG